MSLESFQNKYELHVKPLSLFGIISAVKLLQRQIPKTQLKHESLLDTFLKSPKSSRIVYQKLISDKGERPLSCQEKWHKDISSTNETVDWRKVYQTSTACTRSSKLIDFNFRFYTDGWRQIAICKKLESERTLPAPFAITEKKI